MKTSSTIRAFNLYFLLALGLAFWPIAVQAQTSIACGQIVTNSITAAGQTNLYTLAGNTGDVIRLTSVPISASVEPDIAVFNHIGTKVGGFGYNDGISTLTLPATDTYTVAVYDRNHANTGTYVMSLEYATPKCTATVLTCGMIVTNTLASVVQQDTYSFTGSTGEVIRLTSQSITGGVEPDIDIFDHAGTLVGGFGYNDGISTFTLPETGSYVVLVRARMNNNTGLYVMSLEYATPKCTATVLTCGMIVTNTLASVVQQDTYSFTGSTGEVIRLTSQSITGGVEPDIDIFDHAGTLVGGFGYNDGISTFTLPETGSYVVLVRARMNNNTGLYVMSLEYATPKCTATVLTCGMIVTNTLASVVQQDTYTFNGSAGEAINLDSQPLSGGVEPDIDVFNQFGTEVGGFGYNDAVDTFTLPANSAYTVLVRAHGNDNTGTYRIIFTPYYTINTSFSPAGGGSTSGGGAGNCGSNVTVCETPASCYNFENWTVNNTVVSTSSCYTFTPTNNETLTANFAPTAGRTNQICGVQVEGANVDVSGQSVRGDNYQLQSRNSLLTGSWSNVAGVILSNSPGGLIILTNVGGALPPQKFYRFDITP